MILLLSFYYKGANFVTLRLASPPVVPAPLAQPQTQLNRVQTRLLSKKVFQLHRKRLPLQQQTKTSRAAISHAETQIFCKRNNPSIFSQSPHIRGQNTHKLPQQKPPTKNNTSPRIVTKLVAQNKIKCYNLIVNI